MQLYTCLGRDWVSWVFHSIHDEELMDSILFFSARFPAGGASDQPPNLKEHNVP